MIEREQLSSGRLNCWQKKDVYLTYRYISLLTTLDLVDDSIGPFFIEEVVEAIQWYESYLLTKRVICE